MVRIELQGLIGNNLYQYVVGRLLAERFGLALECVDSPYKPKKNMPQLRALMAAFADAPLQLSGREITEPMDRTAYKGHDGFDGFCLDLEAMLANDQPRGFEVHGFFERYEIFRPHKQTIRRWFHVDPITAGYTIGPDDAVVHIRRGDFVTFGRAITLDYYLDTLHGMDPARVFVCGFGIDPEAKAALEEFDPIYVEGDPVSDFRFMKGFNRIVQSQSTFSWWAGFLSEAEEIYAPLTIPGSTEFERANPNIDLRVDDEPRFHYVTDVPQMKREFGLADLVRARDHLGVRDLAGIGRRLAERGLRHARRALDLQVGYIPFARQSFHWGLYHRLHYEGQRYRFTTPLAEPRILDKYDRILVARMNHSYAGFFACFTFALNQLLFCERNNCLPVINFGQWSSDGPNAYYDEAVGPNVWEYFFEPIGGYSYADVQGWVDDPANPTTAEHVVELSDKDLWYLHTWEPESVFAYTYGRHMLQERFDPAWYAEQRRRAHAVIRRYVRVKPAIQRRVDGFVEEFMDGHHVVGVHLRGTDKGAARGAANTRRKMGPERYFEFIDRQLRQRGDARVFVATDQVQYLDAVRDRYGADRVLSIDCQRSSGDLAPFQLAEGSGYDKGAEVLIDALLLSRCDYLIKCSSHVGEAALWFAPDLPSVDVNYSA